MKREKKIAKAKNNPLVSIVIPVHITAKAEKCLKALERQTYPNIEIITIDRKGFPAEKRNYGFTKSKGEYVFFLDEDEYLSPTAIEDCVREAEKGYDVIAMPIIKKPPVSYMSRCIAITRTNTPKMMFFRRGVLEKIGLFNPKYVLCDDVEILERVIKNNYRIGKVSTCFMLHDEETTLRGVLFKSLFGRKPFSEIAYVCQLPELVRITGLGGTSTNRVRIFRRLLKEPVYIPGVLFVMGLRFIVRRIP
ncbi:MAG: glycosyltransferase family 2 protein [Candidatus Bathyarchaeia archaeon]|jgi:glycosyltransferase involved in cell wall biosynthesis|nr:glycosyltransferase [Candidatus Bathyarchaeota archaeon A05DMB-4]MDH7595792.1 glycosyltransferase [Candidatus Bathyarchaeota archaeon]